MTDDAEQPPFALESFLPYMLNQVAERMSRGFQECYQKDFGITRTQWRIIAHLAMRDGLTAKEIGARIHEDKVPISRAVAALEAGGHLSRKTGLADRRFEELYLTGAGRELFRQLSQRAISFESALSTQLGPDSIEQLRALLAELLRRLEKGQP